MANMEANKKQLPSKKKDRSKAFFAKRAESKAKFLEKKKEKKAQSQGSKDQRGTEKAKCKANRASAKSKSLPSVPQNQLSWHKAEIPRSAADVDGTTDVDFWETLYAAQGGNRGKGKKKSATVGGNKQSVWMGLEEVEGVDVVTEKNGTGQRISFVPAPGYNPPQEKRRPDEKELGKRSIVDEAATENSGTEAGAGLDSEQEGNQEATTTHDNADSVPTSERAKDVPDRSVLSNHGAHETQSAEKRATDSPEPLAQRLLSEEKEDDVPTADDKDEEVSLDHVDWKALGSAGRAEEDNIPSVELEAWAGIPLHPLIQFGLKESGFLKPTPIQAATVGKALEPRDGTIHPHPESLTPAESKPKGKRKRASSSAEQDKNSAKRAPNKGQEDDEEDAGTWHDIVGVAQTGSGKTMAYALPILQRLLQQRDQANRSTTSISASTSASASAPSPDAKTHTPGNPLMGLIICPTRELALQVSDAIRSFVRACMAWKDERIHPFAKVVSVVGGLSTQKQTRELHSHGGADIVVATPGRLWDVVERDDTMAERMRTTRCLVIDEADRVMQDGHFAEMKSLLRILRRSKYGGVQTQDAQFTPGYNPHHHSAPATKSTEDTEGPEQDEFSMLMKEQPPPIERKPNVQPVSESVWGGMQTFIFSATLSATLQVNLQRRRRGELKKARGTQTLDALMDQLDFRDPEPTVVNLSPHSAVAETVAECKTECLNKDKDVYLYYFLLRYPGRSLVFLNSIDGLRRLQPLLQHLNIPAFSLHSNMQQRQRLKVLDRFKNAVPEKKSDAKTTTMQTAVLLATDVAARGLDLPAVDHVVHYQLPRSADTYVHRSGRTGRAGRSGVALSMVEPKEQGLLRQLLRSLGRTSDDEISRGAQGNEADLRVLPVEYSLLPQLRERVTLAAQIDQVEHKAKKESHDDAWLKQLAKDADLDVSDDDDGGSKPQRSKKQTKASSGALKAELNQLLRTPLRLRGVSTKYLTSNALPGFVDDLLHNNNVENMPGVRRVRLDEELAGTAEPPTQQTPRRSRSSKEAGPQSKRARTLA